MKLKNNLVFLLFLLWLSGCYENKEGCLDVRATNFDLDADVPCPNCCTYPSLKLKASHQHHIGDTVYSVLLLDSFYLDKNDQAFRLKSIRYFLSDFKLISHTGAVVSIDDKIDIEVLNSSGNRELMNFVDDFILINASSAPTITLGTFPHPDTYSGIRFKMGLDPLLDSANPNSFPTNHALSNTGDEMYDFVNGHYLSTKIEIFKDTIPQDTIPRLLTSYASISGGEVNLLFPEPVVLPEGFHLTITLGVDCISWFETSDVRLDTDQALMEQILAKAPHSFSIVKVAVN